MKFVLSILGILLTAGLQAQEIAMADEMRANGKIYVVVAVLGVILLGLIIYLISLDRKINRLEKDLNNDK